MSRITDSFFRKLNKGLVNTVNSSADRIVLLVDMDCFYCQVEEKLNPSLATKPIAVVQHNTWRGGGIIAVNYPARNKGVTRHMRGDEAKKMCPDIELVKVPSIRGKADLTKYRDAGKQVAEVLKKFTPLLERASVDEAYLDITESVEKRIVHLTKRITEEHLKNTYVVGSTINDFLHNVYEDEDLNISDLKLAIGGVVAELLRAEVYKETGYQCSAGIAHNKVLAKLACGLNKPNKQTILPQHAVAGLFERLPVSKIRGLGGKFGSNLSDNLGVQFMGDLLKFSEQELAKKFDEKTGTWLYNIARGIDLDPVTTRLVSKSIGCCKKFPGKTALTTSESVQNWLNELAAEIVDRLEQDQLENNRKAKQIVVSFAQEIDKKDVAGSKTTFLNSYNAKKISEDAFTILKRLCMKSDGSFCLKYLGLSVGNFENCKNVREITTFFKSANKSDAKNLNRVSPELFCSEENVDVDMTESNITSNTKEESTTLVSDTTTKENNIIMEQVQDLHPVFDASTDEQSSVHSGELIFYDEFLKNTVTHQETKIVEELYNDGSLPRNVTVSLEAQQCVLEYTSSSDEDSISNEILSSKEKINVEVDQNEEGGSFFMKYFDDIKNSEKQIKRDFNTSKALEVDDTSDDESSSKPVEDEEHRTSEYADDENEIDSQKDIRSLYNCFNNPGTSNAQSNRIQCVECGRKILQTEMASHMDYHVALKIVRSEADLYKHNTASNQSKTVKSSGKRKAIQSDRQHTLESFMKANVAEGNQDCETCSECNKRVCKSELDSHRDYHIAKRLHMEINTKVTTSLKNTGKSKGSTKSKTVHGKIKPVTAFFKPL